MGFIIRLNTTFTNARLPLFEDFDAASLEAQILSMPTLRAFWDPSSSAHRTVSSGKVTQLTDRSGHGHHFVQATLGSAPALAAGVLNGKDGIQFTEAEEMTATGVFGSNVQTVVALLYPTGVTGASAIFLSDKNSNRKNFYVGNATKLRALSGGAELDVPSLSARLVNYMVGFNITGNVSRLYGAGGSVTGTVGSQLTTAGDAYLGRWSVDQSGNKYSGYIGQVLVFDEDIGVNSALRSLLNEYALRKYKLS